MGIWNCFPDSPAILGIQLSHRFDMRPKVGRYRRTTAKACSRFGQERTRHAPKGRGCVRRIRVKAQAKGTRKISPRVACPAILGIQLSHRFDMRPAAWPPYLPSLLFSISVFQYFSISAFQHFSFYQKSTLAKRQPRRKPLGLGEIHDLLPSVQSPLLRQRTQKVGRLADVRFPREKDQLDRKFA